MKRTKNERTTTPTPWDFGKKKSHFLRCMPEAQQTFAKIKYSRMIFATWAGRWRGGLLEGTVGARVGGIWVDASPLNAYPRSKAYNKLTVQSMDCHFLNDRFALISFWLTGMHWQDDTKRPRWVKKTVTAVWWLPWLSGRLWTVHELQKFVAKTTTGRDETKLLKA